MSAQLELFSAVLHAYSAERAGRLDNATLYEEVAERAGIDPEEFARREPIGASGQPHSLLARKVRWYQQTLKHAGILERVEGERGVWQVATPASDDLHRINPGVAVVGFSTELGVAILGSCDTVFASIDCPITLCLTSPPYPLAHARSYGNPSEPYVDWICRTLEPVVRNLVRGGSIALNVSNDIFIPGTPARSLYRERLLLALHDRLGLFKMDELIWHNPSKPPRASAMGERRPLPAEHGMGTGVLADQRPAGGAIGQPARAAGTHRAPPRSHSARRRDTARVLLGRCASPPTGVLRECDRGPHPPQRADLRP